MKRALIILLVAATLSGCGGSSEGGEENSVRITASVILQLRWPMIDHTLDSNESAPKQCAGGKDYAKIATGSIVTFRDASDTIVGTAKLQPPGKSDNLVICTWIVRSIMESDSNFFTAEVGGWKSTPEKVSNSGVKFRLDTIDEDPSFGSTAQVDPTWSSVR